MSQFEHCVLNQLALMTGAVVKACDEIVAALRRVAPPGGEPVTVETAAPRPAGEPIHHPPK